MSEKDLYKFCLEILNRETKREYDRLLYSLGWYHGYLRRVNEYLDYLKRVLSSSDKEIYEGIINRTKVDDFLNQDGIGFTSLRVVIAGGVSSPRYWEIIRDCDPELQEKLNKIEKKIDLINEAFDKIFDIREKFLDKRSSVENFHRERVRRGLYDELLIKYFLEHE
jgi:predicted transcriptional regulator